MIAIGCRRFLNEGDPPCTRAQFMEAARLALMSEGKSIWTAKEELEQRFNGKEEVKRVAKLVKKLFPEYNAN